MNANEIRTKLLSFADWPAEVKDWQVEKGTDATGDDAVWVWAIVDKMNDDWSFRSELRDHIRERVMELDNHEPSWVYTRFRLTSEVEAQ